MPYAQEVTLTNVKIGWYTSWLSVCQDGYSLSNSPVPGFDNSEVLARVNECQPLISVDGNYQNEIIKSVFNIGLKKSTAKSLWITPNSIRQHRFNFQEKGVGEKGLGFADFILHRQFAKLQDKDINHILKFANKYGLLRRQPAHNLVFRNPDTGKQVQMGESLPWWQEEIIDLASCLKLWDMIRSAHKELKDTVLWHRDGIVIRLDNNDIQLVNRANMNLLAKWTKGDTKGPALYYLSLELDKRLANALTPRISASQEHDIYFYPDTLLSAIWLMFLLETSSATRILLCDICGNYFNTRYPRAQFCSTRCRMRNYRKRNAQKLKRRKRVKAEGIT